MQFKSLLLLAGATILSPYLVEAQTYTICNPLNGTCPNDPALGTNHTFIFNTSSTVTDYYNITAGSLTYGDDGAEFTISKQGESPTIQSKFFIFFGSVSVIMKAATGVGVVSSIVLESDDLDEVDWEFIGGNDTHAETNYFGKGNTTSYDRAIWYPTPADPTANFYNYTVDWTAERIEWWIDDSLVRTLAYADAVDGKNFPQTPMSVRLGIWSGGDPKGNSIGTIEWAGGETDFTKVPFTMYVKSATIQDYSTGSAYEWGDRTGDWQSIKVITGNSTVAKTITKNATPTLSLGEKWDNLSKTTKLAVYCGGGAAVAALVSVFLFTFFRQRRNGRLEREAYNHLIEKQQQEAYQDQMELHNKGIGGWDKNAYANQGGDALGGWEDNHGSGYVGPNGSASAMAAGGVGSPMVQAGQHNPRSPTMVMRDGDGDGPMSPQSAEFDMKLAQPRFGGSANGGSYMKM
ncbi:hypothetical protein SBOR_8241 [Sclerotinia borealis F-4128]|uniref:chitinase n=1 Tax=Sclerotinia borealis (strain F-4128) TaxID=1432307 RepID=W9CA10_SCLBF|nr:hypothetical protein SBOR_8241 [Sclerotinia borealis F-4128]